ncbi:unnamed protein product [Effrenium voratum]|uniref:Uncharacterized protein n=1 Tax=Effrenium voratum TaxID=2562239 RepID=A0AA36ITR7_9DINO|nr:unnamed protein product [Effrenium voratum]
MASVSLCSGTEVLTISDFAVWWQETSEQRELGACFVDALRQAVAQRMQLAHFRRLSLVSADRVFSRDSPWSDVEPVVAVLKPFRAASAEDAVRLFQAVHLGDLAELCGLLDEPYADDDGVTPLHLAAQHGRAEVVHCLLQNGADMNKARTSNGDTPLHVAARNRRAEVVNCLLEAGADKDKGDNDGATPLYLCAQHGRAEIAGHLIDAGADKDRGMGRHGITPLQIASRNGHLEIVQGLLEAGADKDKPSNDGFTPLHISSQYGRVDIVECLLKAGADRDKAKSDNGVAPLHTAALHGHSEIVHLLLAAGADKDKANTDGFTALHVAAQSAQLQVLCELLEAGADMDKASNVGVTPLHVAALSGHLQVVRSLLKAGADKDRGNNDGLTPLHLAAGYDHADVARCLLEAGANKDKDCNAGVTPLDLAAYRGHVEIMTSRPSRPSTGKRSIGWQHALASCSENGFVEVVLTETTDRRFSGGWKRRHAAVEAEAKAYRERRQRRATRRSDEGVPTLLLCSKDQAEALQFTASGDSEEVQVAFETFHRAVRQAANAGQAQLLVDLANFEPKKEMATFLADIAVKRKIWRSRAAWVLAKLSEMPSWKAAVEASEALDLIDALSPKAAAASPASSRNSLNSPQHSEPEPEYSDKSLAQDGSKSSCLSPKALPWQEKVRRDSPWYLHMFFKVIGVECTLRFCKCLVPRHIQSIACIASDVGTLPDQLMR